MIKVKFCIWLRKILVSLLIIIHSISFAQIGKITNVPPPPPPPPPPEPVVEEIFKVVEEMPRFPGCENSGGTKQEKKACADKKMLEFIYKHIKYPTMAVENGVDGTVVIQFVVDKDGSITDAKIARDIGATCGAEALRVVNLMNQEGYRWIPGKIRGRPVKVQFNLPVKFKLEDNYSPNYYSNGQIKFIESNENYLNIKTWFLEDGSVERKESYRNDIKHGEWVFREGNVQVFCNYLSGLKEGVERRYWSRNGKLAWETYYENGEINGYVKGFYDNGQKKFDEYIQINENIIYPDGGYNTYFYNGNVKTNEIYKNGLRNGPSIEFHENGKLRFKSNFIDGKLHGPYFKYYDNGNLEEKGNFVEDQLNGPIFKYYPDGILIFQKTFKNGILDGPFVEFDDWNGTIKLNYRNGKKHGPYQEINLSGIIVLKGNYNNGYKIGEWFIYNEIGKLIWKEFYNSKGELITSRKINR